MSTLTTSPNRTPLARDLRKEPWTEQSASFIGFFIYLLILKAFFIPLFIIPTGSMAETLTGEHSLFTCPNCGIEYAINQPMPRARDGDRVLPSLVCPNCRWSETLDSPLALPKVQGDRIFVHGWDSGPPFAGWFTTGPQRWDVVVFKVPSDGQTNYIKRIIGLPGETIQLIGGDVFANGEIVRKPYEAQRSLWTLVYDHDFPPQRGPEESRAPFHLVAQTYAQFLPTLHAPWRPQFAAATPGGAWRDLGTRVLRFDGATAERESVRFITDAASGEAKIVDFYGYNGLNQPGTPVSDVRVAAEVRFEGGEGFVELTSGKREDEFAARLYADGRLTLEHQPRSGGSDAQVLGEARVDTSRVVRLALANADYRVRIEVDGAPIIETTDAQYSISLEQALAGESQREFPRIGMAAARCRATLSHIRIERDVYYLNYPEGGVNPNVRTPRPAHGSPESPIQLRSDEYFCCGDNSPNSLDGRYWYPESVGPHLADDMERGEYTPGTVPADQMIGRAFFVYWPGFLPLGPTGINVLPDVGRARWIR